MSTTARTASGGLYNQGSSPPARSAGMNDCVSRVCYYGMGVGWDWDWDGDPWGAACVAGIGDPNPKT